MTRIVHLSDLHFDRVDRRVVDALRDEINADPPDLIAVSGDLTQRAYRHEYRSSGAFLRSLNAPVLAVPGNHDITYLNMLERFLDPYRRWRRFVSRDIEPIWRDETVAVVGLNTARRFTLGFDWSKGRYGVGQLRKFRKRVQELPPNLFRIVVAHHPLHPPETEPELAIVGRAERALACFQKLRIGLVLSGHLHRDYVHTHSVEADDETRMVIVQASTATSTRLRGEPNAYHRLTIDPSGEVVIEVRAWDGERWREAPAREQGARLRLPSVEAPSVAAEAEEPTPVRAEP
ncbi:metallophosphoesterase [Hansschlegelia sp.]|uniref:metallophosphoesterase family protein n=1 Tax=Hansschlegelia sp. TaxID=2041892 RepID=UPI002CA1B478|nr:metallophosphoesterase [Hansschlegelia sp.]HVI28901.1 metallophosphoesterase [Hansschlegelia sp.]